MASPWRALPYPRWQPTRDTLHAHTQVLGKLAVALAPPAPDGSGPLVVALDLRSHEVAVEHSDGRVERVALTPNRAVGAVTRDVLAAVGRLAGTVTIDPTPQETPWRRPLDEDDEHATYEPSHVSAYFDAATQAALVLAALRAPFRGRSTPVNAWWGSFDLALNLFSGRAAEPPSQDFSMRNSMNVQEVAVGWWPGDARYERAAFYAYAHPAPEGFSNATLAPAAARWDDTLGEFILDWDDVVGSDDPRAAALAFARSAALHACLACAWEPALAASLEGTPPPVA